MLKNRLGFIFIIMISCACEKERECESIDVYLDPDCLTEDQELIHQGVDDLNWVIGADVINLIDEGDEFPEGEYGFVCNYSYYGQSNKRGFFGGTYVKIFFHYLDNDIEDKMEVIKHELVHLLDGDIDVDEHSKSKKDIMYPYLLGISRYSKGDISIIEEILDRNQMCKD